MSRTYDDDKQERSNTGLILMVIAVAVMLLAIPVGVGTLRLLRARTAEQAALEAFKAEAAALTAQEAQRLAARTLQGKPMLTARTSPTAGTRAAPSNSPLP